ncbi:Shikimate kinase 2 [anaerobic digester metagenome]|uniref:shikimate kinase n=1 Tax=Oscillibacter ruminantium TaxID=1263547 RepID=UPI002B1F588E|nr:shikimate kinase [Oscillibacter ruminantium]MEA5042846.1 shikimate kinase [Oscillibacter ruminantium]
MKNLILIGMPGTGKSAVGKALAERLGYTFLDVDDVIRERTGKTLKDLLLEMGVDEFVVLEGKIGESLDLHDTVIATGGSMVLSGGAMDHLRENGVAVWLETPLREIEGRMPEDLWDRGIAAPRDMTIREIYRQRESMYAKYADVIVASQEGEDATACQVEQVMRTAGMSLRE